MKLTLAQYAKLLAALLAAVLIAAQSAVSDGHISAAEGVQIAIAVVTAFSVWITANIPGVAGYAKSIVAAVLAGLNLAVTYLHAGPITTSEWANIGLAVLGAAGVLAVPNTTVTRSSTDLLPGAAARGA